MNSERRWFGPALDSDQRDLQDMITAFTESHSIVLDDGPDVVGGLIVELAALGLWTLGTAEEHGGGGANRTTTAVVQERLGRSWPALGWAATQAHVAVDVLAGDDRFADLVEQLHGGRAAIAVVDENSAHVRIENTAGTVTGAVDRIDAAGERPHLLILGNGGLGLLVVPDAMTFTPLERAGLGGASSRSLVIDGTVDTVHVIRDVDVSSARIRLWSGAAIVAAGIAAAATESAVEYAAGRHQFGAALTVIPAVRQILFAQASRSFVGAAAALGAQTGLQVVAAVDEACTGAIEVAASALQSHGGYGYLAEYGAERRFRDALSLRAAADPGGAARISARELVGVDTPASVLDPAELRL
ncbi:acyl-CoA dehydrogenase [Rhodococcoides fascians]|uniref:acyl-CoA dehydrogenase family protein n=1 Tax=Rhodococcoides fascians TaxID=1828 RepID=UPI000B9BBB65|nr:acyl-CoA dehydrogenase family protein [Rhodococcus fascians]OZE81347.1 acyl-CoA dehydrogenase [Rhodococcus fascians]OZF10171.1 acyl-CoA dehydrogenase [Rhodococcus fascians]OZF13262.1 acyl-CoA dehydrogenase [Rhodococcus fascians]OZF59359.1 acyl-CoA dehydrogenase [Rhodococcus fascians]OZF60475.1 acyl-CoA dehydrogenase [Rhodococcus fascians]